MADARPIDIPIRSGFGSSEIPTPYIPDGIAGPCISSEGPISRKEKARIIRNSLPKDLFRGISSSFEPVAWRCSPEPFPLSQKTLAAIEMLGDGLALFLRVLGELYTQSTKGNAPSFVAEYLDAGKPESVVQVGRHINLKGDIPGVIRPDLILTEDGFIACEIDSVPGGMGFVGAMAHAYSAIGIETIGGRDGMAQGFSELLKSVTTKERPVVAIVVSDESGDYRSELTWMATHVTKCGICCAYVCAPQDILVREESLWIRLADEKEAVIDVIYRNFELFDLHNVPNSELMLLAACQNKVKMTPPPRAILEEKLSFALLHHPRLATIWRKQLGLELFNHLRSLFPQSWVLDPRPLPPQASITNLEAAGEPVYDWTQLFELKRSERAYVVKPSGFNELAWGSRGVRVANDLNKEAWKTCLREGLSAYPQRPHILQRFHKGRRVKMSFLEARNDELESLHGRVRLCPYFFTTGNGKTQLGGILATVVPLDKRLIHGMADAVMAPCYIEINGY